MRTLINLIVAGALTLATLSTGAFSKAEKIESESGSLNQPRAVAEKTTIKIKNFEFTPAEVSIAAGTTVEWLNEGGRHTVEADNRAFKSPELTAGQKFEFTFTKPGTYAYHCGFHGEAGGGGMAGKIVVTKK